MTDHILTESQFLKDVSEHEMRVALDNGIYRHLVFAKPDSGTYSFSIVTIPGRLIYVGDMGTFVFQRLNDMFEFFRPEQDQFLHQYDDDQLIINPGYWSGKVIASDGRRGDGVFEFSNEKLHEAVRYRCAEFMRDKLRASHCSPKEAAEIVENRLDLIRDLRHHFLDEYFFSEHEARIAVENYYHQYTDFSMPDFSDHNLTEYRMHFIWCCYAIVWGIRTYDQRQAKRAKGAA